ncbi:MAG: 4-(cytidine 5'-diphospho)-2-C-methyl-D-erythritol kinase [Armatimonadetes bacterium]|nr:4-(cytidine 5'-diphospho)-2-C-methyl-D-erythritol kinase [Armatimonadota bacterium]
MITVRCPAKINTFLAVAAPDRSGYHPLRTVFQAVSLFDTVVISTAHQFSITSNWAELPVENTLTKTLRMMKELIDVPPVHIHLEKQIPSESGLGGGSSDAAGLIRGVLKLMRTEFPWGQDVAIAAAIGADVPFFLVGGRARAEGYGEKLTPLEDCKRGHFVIVRPDVSCPTPVAYSKLDELRSNPELKQFPEGDEEFFNDFESVAPDECRDVAERLYTHGASESLLCGSGSAVFGKFESLAGAERAHQKMKNEGYEQSWTVHSLTRAESLWMS